MTHDNHHCLVPNIAMLKYPGLEWKLFGEPRNGVKIGSSVGEEVDDDGDEDDDGDDDACKCEDCAHFFEY